MNKFQTSLNYNFQLFFFQITTKFYQSIQILLNMTKIKLVSWNVNGIRAVLSKGFIDSIKKLNADIVCLQETKAHPEQIDYDLEELGYTSEYWNSAEKKGYSGTVIFSKIEPISVCYGIGCEDHDKEGRVITAEFEKFYLVNVYTPNSQRGLTRLDYRMNWNGDFLKYLKGLEKKKPVIFCGDLNVAHKEIDIKNFQSNKTTKTKPGSAGFTDDERKGFDEILENGFIDTFRYFHKDVVKYTWWSYMFNSRAKNVGWRLDYFCVSGVLSSNLLDAGIDNEIFDSDHCPITLGIFFS